MKRHLFHLVDRSPWPFLISFSLLFLATGMVMYMHFYEFGGYLALTGLILLILTMIAWWRDVIRESTHLGYHSKAVQKGLKVGFILFIASEVMFFLAFFWAFFHASLAPSI
jgi:cytochrome c oxidase subunit 3